MLSQPHFSVSVRTEKNKNGVQVRFNMYNVHDCYLISVYTVYIFVFMLETLLHVHIQYELIWEGKCSEVLVMNTLHVWLMFF